MKSVLVLLLFLSYTAVTAEEIVRTKDGSQVVLFDDHTWKVVTPADTPPISVVELRKELRPGIIASDDEIRTAGELLAQGWRYTMPEPKSAKAAWGVRDGRTTWWNGYWENSKLSQYSDSTPKKGASGLYLGDNQTSKGSWRNGGSPPQPDVYMFLLSSTGGPHS